MLLVEDNFNKAVRNYMDIPVYNPSTNQVIPIKVDRKFKAPIHVKDDTKKKGKDSHQKTQKEIEAEQKKTKEEKDKEEEERKKREHEELEEKWRRKLNQKKKEKGEAVEYEKAKQYAKTHIDYWRAFEDRASFDLEVLSPAERKSVINGGYDLGVKDSMEYFKSDDMTKDDIKYSIMYPPMYSNSPQMPKEAKINFIDLDDAMIVRIQPPVPQIQGTKWTFFFVAPTKFNYPDGKRVWIPVYILVPYDSDERPTDLRPFSTFRIKKSIGLTKMHKVHVPVTARPHWTPKKMEEMIKDPRFVNMSLKPFDKIYYLNPEDFELYLKTYKLINKGIGFKEKDYKQHLDPFKRFVKSMYKSLMKNRGLKQEIFRGGETAAVKLAKNLEIAAKQRRSRYQTLKRKHSKNVSDMMKRVAEMNKRLALLRDMLDLQNKGNQKDKENSASTGTSSQAGNIPAKKKALDEPKDDNSSSSSTSKN